MCEYVELMVWLENVLENWFQSIVVYLMGLIFSSWEWKFEFAIVNWKPLILCSYVVLELSFRRAIFDVTERNGVDVKYAAPHAINPGTIAAPPRPADKSG